VTYWSHVNRFLLYAGLLSQKLMSADCMEIIFLVRDSEDGGYCARALGYAIFTEAETWEELRNNVLEAVSLHFDEAEVRTRLVQLHYLENELLRVEAA
jgi:hypothetical protein